MKEIFFISVNFAIMHLVFKLGMLYKSYQCRNFFNTLWIKDILVNI